MSVFGSLMGDMEDDPIFGSHMRHMRQMSTMMNSLFSDPFGMMNGFSNFENSRALAHRHNVHNSLMAPFSMPLMPNFNRLLSGSLDSVANASNFSSSSSTVISMTSGPDGRPQVYKATSSTRVAPGGVKETQKTVTDTMTGTKKMSIGHHIGDRAHIIEKEQNMRTGDREEREDLINIEDDEKDTFNNEWEARARCRSEIPRITAGSSRNRHSYGGHSAVPAITAGSSSSTRRHRDRNPTSAPLVSARRSIRSTKLALPSNSASSSLARTPYSPPQPQHHPSSRKSKNVKTVSGSPPQVDI